MLKTLRHARLDGSIVVTSDRGPDECLPTFADPVRAQSALDRYTSNSFDLVIEGESYRAPGELFPYGKEDQTKASSHPHASA